MKKRFIFTLFAVLACAFVFAHTPLLSVFDNGDGTITCEGGFSNGASAEGVEIRIEKNDKAIKLYDEKGTLLGTKAKLNKAGELTVKRPKGDFVVIFDAGPGHVVKVMSKDIEK